MASDTASVDNTDCRPPSRQFSSHCHSHRHRRHHHQSAKPVRRWARHPSVSPDKASRNARNANKAPPKPKRGRRLTRHKMTDSHRFVRGSGFGEGAGHCSRYNTGEHFAQLILGYYCRHMTVDRRLYTTAVMWLVRECPCPLSFRPGPGDGAWAVGHGLARPSHH